MNARSMPRAVVSLRSRPGVLSLVVACALAACAEDSAEEEMVEEVVRKIDQKDLTDLDSSHDVVEVELAASPGSARYLPDGSASIWGYRDAAIAGSRATVPGPRLELERGQRVIVHFTNELPEPTTVHWHGLRVPNGADGTSSVQTEVAPGETFDYEFVASDAGTFWYHPHVRSDEQIERGLYGAIRVHGGPEIAVTTDRTFVLDDVKLESTGKLSTTTTPLDVMLGRQGNVIVANGVRSGQITVREGARERWRFVNSANGRYFNLRLQRHTMQVIAWDGGLLSEPYEVDSLLIAPGERYEVLVTIDAREGSTLKLETLHYDRGHNVPDPGPRPVFAVAVEGTARRLSDLPGVFGDPMDFDVPANAVEREIELAEEENAGGFPKFFINGAAFPDVAPIVAHSGDVEVWKVHNTSEMDHPFHLHGMFFKVLDVDGTPPDHQGWKDTVNVPKEQTLRFAVRYAEPGMWMYHCHILEHAERGMMAELHVLDPSELHQGDAE